MVCVINFVDIYIPKKKLRRVNVKAIAVLSSAVIITGGTGYYNNILSVIQNNK